MRAGSGSIAAPIEAGDKPLAFIGAPRILKESLRSYPSLSSSLGIDQSFYEVKAERRSKASFAEGRASRPANAITLIGRCLHRYRVERRLPKGFSRALRDGIYENCVKFPCSGKPRFFWLYAYRITQIQKRKRGFIFGRGDWD